MHFLTRLRRPGTSVDYPDDVKQISDELKRQGFDATGSDIAWAYGEFCEARWCTSWICLSDGPVSVLDATKGVREFLV